MSTLPIIERELRVRARQQRTHWTRVFIGGLAVLFCLQFFVLWGQAYGGLAQTAGVAFQTLSWMGFLLACAGCLLTADCLSSEQRDGTLGLLMLARVSAREVVLGKLTVHGLAAVLGLVTLAPMLMLPVLAGGVTWQQVLWTAISWLAMLWFSVCLGLWTSSQGGTLAQSLKRAALCFLVFTIPLLLLGTLQFHAGAMAMGDLVRTLSPAAAFVETWDMATTPPGAVLFGSLVVSGGLGLLFLELAASRLRRGLGTSVENGPAERADSSCLAARPPLGDLNPLQWLLIQDKVQVWLLWLAAAINWLVPLLTLMLITFRGIAVAGIFSSIHILGGIGSTALFALAGARVFNGVRRDGGMELLQTTPLGADTLFHSAEVVLRRRLIGPLLLLIPTPVVVNLYYLISTLSAPTPISFNPGVLLVGLVLAPASVGLDAVALCWLGMWFGLRARSLLSAVLLAVVLVWGLDWIMSYGFRVFHSLYLSLVSGGARGWWSFSMIAVPVLTSVKQIWLLWWARKQLRENFAGREWEPFDWRKASHAAMDWVRGVRHWTGGGA